MVGASSARCCATRWRPSSRCRAPASHPDRDDHARRRSPRRFADCLARFPPARWHQWDPASRDNARAGAQLAFGEYVDRAVPLRRADVIVALDADFLGCGPGSLRYAREFAARRRPEQADRMNRLYAVESMPTSTGARADHRLPLRPSEIETIARAAGGGARRAAGVTASSRSRVRARQRWVAAVAKDLQAHRGSSLVVAGDGQPPAVHALAHAMNAALGNAGRTVVYTDPVEAAPVDQLQSMRELAGDMNAGRSTRWSSSAATRSTPRPPISVRRRAEQGAAARASQPRTTTRRRRSVTGRFPRRTSSRRGATRARYDGTVSIVQPLIAPLYGGTLGARSCSRR